MVKTEEDTKEAPKLGGSPSRPTLSQTVGRLAFKSPEKSSRLVNWPKKEEIDEKPSLRFPSPEESKPATGQRRSAKQEPETIGVEAYPSPLSPQIQPKLERRAEHTIVAKAEIIDVDAYPSPLSLEPPSRSLTPDLSRRKLRKRKARAVVDSDSEGHSDFNVWDRDFTPEPGSSRPRRAAKGKGRSAEGKPRSRKKPRSYAEPEEYAHLNEVPDRLGKNLDGEQICFLRTDTHTQKCKVLFCGIK